MFTNRIRILIKERGYTIKFVAKKIGVSDQTLSNWCNNRSQPDLKQAYILSVFLKCDLNEMVEKED